MTPGPLTQGEDIKRVKRVETGESCWLRGLGTRECYLSNTPDLVKGHPKDQPEGWLCVPCCWTQSLPLPRGSCEKTAAPWKSPRPLLPSLHFSSRRVKRRSRPGSQ